MAARKNSKAIKSSNKFQFKELGILYLYFLIICFLALVFKLELFAFSFLYMLVPGVYFSIKQSQLTKNILESLCFSLPFGLYVDYFARITKTWESISLLDFKLFGVVTLEIQFWGIAYSLLALSCYKYFFDESVSTKISENYKKYLAVLAFATVFFLIIIIGQLNPFLPYYYLQLNIIWMSILIVGLIKYPHLLKRIIFFGLVLFPFHFLHEIVSLELNHWFFENGNHISYLTVLDNYVFPIEELLWLMQVMPTIAILHEYFVDNKA